MSNFKQIRVSSSGTVAHIALDRPERHNAQTERLWSELAEVGALLAEDGRTSVVVLSGNGPSFSSGIDLSEMKAGGFLHRLGTFATGEPDPMLRAISLAQNSVRWLREGPFLVVAAVHGNALGAGCQLALAADIVIAAEDAKFAIKEVEYGLIPDLGATATLPALVGRQRALELILTGRTFEGREAVRMGIALEAVPAAEVLFRALDLADAIARNSRTAVAAVKQAVDEVAFEESLLVAARGQAACIRARRS